MSDTFAIPEGPAPVGEGEDDSPEEEEEDEAARSEPEGEKDMLIPITDEVNIPAHEKACTALSVNPKASRMITGGLDSQVRIWDFNGMTSSMKSFRQLTPSEGHGIQAVCYSCSGSHFLCAAGHKICLLYDLDGQRIQQKTTEGDMYIRDTANTKGHTHMVTDCKWHPFNREEFMTASMDATIRLWDVNSKPYGVDQTLAHVHCLKVVDKRKMNISNCHVTTSDWAPSGKIIVAGCVDGSLQFFNEKARYGKSDIIIREAHAGCDVTAVQFFNDSHTLVSRGADSCLRLWDVRNPKDPIHEWPGVSTPSLSKSGVGISPDEAFVFAGTPVDRNDKNGTLQFFNVDDGKKAKEVVLPEFGVLKCIWPEEINQLILAGHQGTVKMMYDKEQSQKGALFFVGRAAAKPKTEFVGYQEKIYTPNSLPMFRDFKKLKDLTKKKVKEDKTIVPPRPAMGDESAEGVVANRGKFSNFFIQSVAKSESHNEDPVEVLRRFAEKNKGAGGLVTTAYKDTQPIPVLDYTIHKDKGADLLSDAKKCPRCGLKICHCGYMKMQAAIQGPPTKERRLE